MVESFAAASDVADRWRPLSAAEQELADVLVGDASDMIRDRWPDVDDRIGAGVLSARSVTRVVAGMVKRAMVGGADVEGVEAQSQNAGPFGVSVKYVNPTGNLYLSAEDVRLLGGRRGGRRAFSVDLTPPTVGPTY